MKNITLDSLNIIPIVSTPVETSFVIMEFLGKNAKRTVKKLIELAEHEEREDDYRFWLSTLGHIRAINQARKDTKS